MSAVKMYPLKFKPIFKERIWGGQKLRELFGKDLPPNTRIGESWELADLPQDKSLVANGPLAGSTIGAVVAGYGAKITGRGQPAEAFPLLIKFLDAQDVLSVQVHPDEQACRRMGKGVMKTECWYIVAAEDGAVIYKGLKKAVTSEQFAAAIEDGSVAELLEKVEVRRGECHYLPAGTAHAVGPGQVIAEIQTPSDTTYRVFDWNRVDENGEGRPLHIAEAMESIHFDSAGRELPVTTLGRLVDCPYFKVDKGHQARKCELFLSAGEMKTLVVLTGFGTIVSPDGAAVEFQAGDVVLVPASFEGAARFGADTEYLTVTV